MEGILGQIGQTRDERLKEIAAIAVKIEAETSLPAKLMIAQWALETMWGARQTGNHNYFGIEKAARHDKCCTVTTHEYIGGKRVKLDLEFADYDSLEASCRDYAWLITQGAPYREAWLRYKTHGGFYTLLNGVARVYATDPAYSDKLRQIAAQANVATAITEASKIA